MAEELDFRSPLEKFEEGFLIAIEGRNKWVKQQLLLKRSPADIAAVSMPGDITALFQTFGRLITALKETDDLRRADQEKKS